MPESDLNIWVLQAAWKFIDLVITKLGNCRFERKMMKNEISQRILHSYTKFSKFVLVDKMVFFDVLLAINFDLS